MSVNCQNEPDKNNKMQTILTVTHSYWVPDRACLDQLVDNTVRSHSIENKTDRDHAAVWVSVVTAATQRKHDMRHTEVVLRIQQQRQQQQQQLQFHVSHNTIIQC